MGIDPILKRIHIYPIKSLDGFTVPGVRITEAGALEGDRAFAMEDEGGRLLSGKREEKLFRLRARYPEGPTRAELTREDTGEGGLFSLEEESEREQAEEFLSRYLERRIRLKRDARSGFPDDRDASGPTLVSTATIRAVAAWFPGIDPEEMERRLRPNLVVESGEPFFEDRLYTAKGGLVEFRVGEALLLGVNPCRRCTVPTRDSRTGEPYPDFKRIFEERRKESLPPFASRDRFDTYYRLTLNTRIARESFGSFLSAGDSLAILGEVSEAKHSGG